MMDSKLIGPLAISVGLLLTAQAGCGSGADGADGVRGGVSTGSGGTAQGESGAAGGAATGGSANSTTTGGGAIGAGGSAEGGSAQGGSANSGGSGGNAGSSSGGAGGSGGSSGQVAKFVGNITTNGAVRDGFVKYWNQITPENEGKWGSVEQSKGNRNWTALDKIYKYAQDNNIPYKHHNFVWGSQQPGWVSGLSA